MKFFLFGFLGGLIRGAVGLIKYIYSYKDVPFKAGYFLSSLLVSGFIGYVSAWIVNDLGMSLLGFKEVPLSLAVIIGYAGGDFIENIFKIITKKPELFEIGKKEEKEK